MTKSARTAWTLANHGGSLKPFWLLSAAVHAGLLGGLALLPSGDGPGSRPGYPVRLVRLSPPEEGAPAPPPASPASSGVKPAPQEAVPPAQPREAAAPKPEAPGRAAQPPKKREAAPRGAAASPSRASPAAPPARGEPAPAPPRKEEIVSAAPAPPVRAEAPPRPAPQAAPSPSPSPPRSASLPTPPAEAALSPGALRERLAQIVARIEKAKRYPERARLMGVEGTAVVAFRILPDGRVSGLAIRQASGHSSLDAAALEAVRRAQPFPYVHHALVLPIRYTLRDAER